MMRVTIKTHNSLLFNSQHPGHGWLKNLANTAANLAGAGLGRICKKNQLVLDGTPA